MKTLIRLALIASILYGTGAHWAALQVYAWTTMRAAGQTDPCKVCRIVEKGSAEQAPVKKVAVPSLDLAVPAPLVLAVAFSSTRPASAPFVRVVSPSFRPPTPPPDSALPA